MDYTHIIINHSADDKEYLYRASDGMRIGGRQHSVVVYGDNPNKSESRVFLDPHQAHAYLAHFCTFDDLRKRDIHDIAPKIDFRSGDPEHIIIPEGMGEEFMGGQRTIRKVI